MLQELSIGDKINSFTVIETGLKLKPHGNGILLQCDCGELVGPLAPVRLFRRGNRKGIYSCKKCSFIFRGEKQRLYSDGQARHAVYSRYKVSAQRRNIEFDIDKEYFFNIILKPCVYCNSEKISFASKPKSSPWQSDFFYTGIDRIDSNYGYIDKNIQPCCKWCNIAKSNRSEKEFLDWIKTVYENKKK